MDVPTIIYPIGAVFGVLWAAIESRQARKRAHAAAQAAQVAAKKLEPVSNGFADDVKKALRRIEDKIDGHVADHASADVRGVRDDS